MKYSDFIVRTFGDKSSEWTYFAALSMPDAAGMYANRNKLTDGDCVEVMSTKSGLPAGYPIRFKVIKPTLTVVQET